MAASIGRALGKLAADKSILFVCDVQTAFKPVIYKMPSVVDTIGRTIRGCNELSIPVLVTEQYPKALGNTVDELKQHLKPTATVIPKLTFSMLSPEGEEALKALGDRRQVLLCGVEAHVCVLQTTLDLVERGYEVHVLVDGVSSQRPEDREVALQRMQSAGALMSTSEMALFQLMGHAKHPVFKAISALAKEKREPQLGL